jgi:hypothetical protein
VITGRSGAAILAPSDCPIASPRPPALPLRKQPASEKSSASAATPISLTMIALAGFAVLMALASQPG